jgi:predicted transcriptional regulator
METTIKVSQQVKETLGKMRMHHRETFNDVIELMIEDNLELNPKTKKSIEEAKKRISRGEFHTQDEVEKMFGLK